MAVPEDMADDCGPEGSGMDCDEAVRQLYTYLDGELTEDRRHDIADHLDACGPCAGAAEFESELRAIIASHCRDRVPQTLIDRVAQVLRDEGSPTGPAESDPAGAGR
jgi:mycothiol system anti-sigma-R factor